MRTKNIKACDNFKRKIPGVSPSYVTPCIYNMVHNQIIYPKVTKTHTLRPNDPLRIQPLALHVWFHLDVGLIRRFSSVSFPRSLKKTNGRQKWRHATSYVVRLSCFILLHGTGTQAALVQYLMFS